MKANKGATRIPPLILNLCTMWRSVVNFTPRPLYPGKEPRYPLYRRLGGTHNLSGRFGEGKNISSLAQLQQYLDLQVKFKHIFVVNLTVVFCCKLHSNRRLVRQNVISRKPPVQTHSQFGEISANSEESYRMFGLKGNQFAETTNPRTEWSLMIFRT